ncbi:DMT family transporter [Thermomonas sp.]|uniref:DMT family transporter n=1 Tax=Thermomonas sp. TaxID=1971895 RepID=UPI0026077EC3|nr:DMT family transporter [Thermomonas sp.]
MNASPPSPAIAPRGTQARAALLMLASAFGFGLMALFIRLASASAPTWEIAFFRVLFGFLILFALLFLPMSSQPRPWQAFLASVHTRQLPRYVVRCAIGVAAMFCGFWAIAHLPLAQAISLNYSSPIFVTVAAILMLGERVRARRWAAVIGGFIGVMVIVRPGSDAFSAGSLVAVASAMLSALVAIQIKQLSAIDKADTIVFWTYALWVPMTLVPALWAWRMPHGIVWLWLLLAGIMGTAGQLLWTRALKLGDVSALTPISFTQLPVVAFAGWLFFDEAIDMPTIVGAGIILASAFYIAHREAVLARRAASKALCKSNPPVV